MTGTKLSSKMDDALSCVPSSLSETCIRDFSWNLHGIIVISLFLGLNFVGSILCHFLHVVVGHFLTQPYILFPFCEEIMAMSELLFVVSILSGGLDRSVH